jgi:hypothetical protein
MKNLSQAVQVAVFVRDYLRKNTMINRPDPSELAENYERIAQQLKAMPDFGKGKS